MNITMIVNKRAISVKGEVYGTKTDLYQSFHSFSRYLLKINQKESPIMNGIPRYIATLSATREKETLMVSVVPPERLKSGRSTDIKK